MESYQEKIRAFMFSNFLFDAKESELDNDSSFLEEGIVDSTGLLELIQWIEETFAININDDELIPDNLDSVNNLAKFILKKQKK